MSAKQAINDKLQGSVDTYLRCDGVPNNQIKKGLLLSVCEWIFFKSVNIWQSYKQKHGCLMHFARLANAKAVECLLFLTFIVVWLFSDKGRSLVRREWQWEGMGINCGNGTGMGIKSEASWEWNWEWTEGNVTEWECCKQFPRISSVYT